MNLQQGINKLRRNLRRWGPDSNTIKNIVRPPFQIPRPMVPRGMRWETRLLHNPIANIRSKGNRCENFCQQLASIGFVV
jgi:hypothetical protein